MIEVLSGYSEASRECNVLAKANKAPRHILGK